jgi:hypothetical protein
MSIETRSSAMAAEAELLTAPADRLFRMPLPVFHGMVQHGLLAERDAAVYAEADEIPVVIDGSDVGRIAARDVLP